MATTRHPVAATSPFGRVATHVHGLLERWFWLWATSLVFILLSLSIAQDVRSKMWLDELYTLQIARLPSPAQMIRAMFDGADAAPPLYAILVHYILPIAKNNEALAVRLPSTIGYWAMPLFLMAFLRRRWSAEFAAVAPLLVCLWCIAYATEGRAYGLVLCSAAASLWAWQAAIESRYRVFALILLSISLSAMTALHYYAVFFLVPLAVGEISRYRRSRRIDWGVAASFVPCLAVLALHYPLIRAVRGFQAHFWSVPSWSWVLRFYEGDIPSATVSLSFAVFLLLFVCGVVLLSKPQAAAESKIAVMPWHEWLVIGVMTLTPSLVVIVTMYTSHAFVARYVLWALIGPALLVIGTVYVVAGKSSILGIAMLAIISGTLLVSQVRALHSVPFLRASYMVDDALQNLPDSTEPIVLGNEHSFMELAYYSPKRIRDRLVFALDRDLYLQYVGEDSGPILMSALQHWSQLPIRSLDEVLALNKHFVIEALPGDFLLPYLFRAGYQLTPIAVSGTTPVLFEAQAPAGANRL